MKICSRVCLLLVVILAFVAGRTSAAQPDPHTLAAYSLTIDQAIDSVISWGVGTYGATPYEGGDYAAGLALKDLQARLVVVEAVANAQAKVIAEQGVRLSQLAGRNGTPEAAR